MKPRPTRCRACVTPCLVALISLAITPASIADVGHVEGSRLVESADVYAISVDGTVAVLPQPLRAFYDARRDDLKRAAIEAQPDGSGDQESDTTLDPHTVALDADPTASPASFPRRRERGKALQRGAGLQPVGVLPWTVLDRFGALTESFRAHNADRIVHDTGTLLHAAMDASLPFNTTHKLYTADWPHTTGSSDARADNDGDYNRELRRSLRYRWQVELMVQMRDRAVYEVRIDRRRVRPIDDPQAAVFAELVVSHGLIGLLTEIDAEIMDGLGIHSGVGFESRSEAYYRHLAERAGWILTARVEAGSVLGARLILTAWSAAGRPDLAVAAGNRAARSEVAKGAGADERAAPTVRYIGSRNSNIMHKSDCPHAQRIKPENRVKFDSRQEARNVGRKPCRTCKPDQ